jgi:hypothetical protein
MTILVMPESPLIMIVEPVFLIRGKNERRMFWIEAIMAAAAYAAYIQDYDRSMVERSVHATV